VFNHDSVEEKERGKRKEKEGNVFQEMKTEGIAD